MKVVTAEEMQRIDRITIDERGIPAEVLMGYAGKAVAEYILAVLEPVKKVAVFSGTGNNGGDGFVIAYFLSNNGIETEVYVAGVTEKLSNSSDTYLNVCRNCNTNITLLDEQKLRKIDFKRYDLIIDALLGTGFKGIPRGIIKDVIIKINQCTAKVLSVDLPSGLPSDGEVPEGEVVNADYTVTVGLPKISLVTHPGIRYTGRLHISDIGFPAVLLNSAELSIDLLDKDYIQSRLNFSRDVDSHKGSAGHILLVGGFDNMEGAILMTAMAAFETGVGLASLLTSRRAREIIAGRIPELITRSIDSFDFQEQKGNVEEDIKAFFNEDRRYDAMIIGPGMGRSESASLLFHGIIDNIAGSGIKRALIDGDGLYHLSGYLKVKRLPEDITFVLTPHFSEASRLLSKPADELKNNRLSSAKELAKVTSSIALLKGPSTIITDGKNSLINTTGNSALGTAGSGDVLSGIIGALLLRDIAPLDCAGIGAYIHGLAADLYIGSCNLPVLKATDLIKYIRIAIAKIL